ncbi:predicted protein [Naegleria gruberi]|uniref:Predicted protein n=1 Tax=Naegleria gruberi TaxID=5762 RepID=D2VG19_NAEGR|nr:uncharacterized protein NAEGRDRAFT_67823 [Naegleria gruberi]EFC44278.1 predicted protein [Naegleria gruberi]|eukprot:XP_002677022.1 predicted protein [Naegleria gruberi strain NEG-M]
MHFTSTVTFCCLLLLCAILSSSVSLVYSQDCSIEKDGMIVDLSQSDNGQSGWQVPDYIPGSYYMVNLCKPVIPTNATCATNHGSYQIVYIDNYFHRCLNIGKPGPKISLFDPSNIAHGIVVEFDMILSSNNELSGAKFELVCDEKVDFNGHYIGKSKKLLKKEYTYEFKIITKYACPRRKQASKNPILIRGAFN